MFPALTQQEFKILNQALEKYLDDAIKTNQSSANVGDIYKTMHKLKRQDNIAVRSHSCEP